MRRLYVVALILGLVLCGVIHSCRVLWGQPVTQQKSQGALPDLSAKISSPSRQLEPGEPRVAGNVSHLDSRDWLAPEKPAQVVEHVQADSLNERPLPQEQKKGSDDDKDEEAASNADDARAPVAPNDAYPLLGSSEPDDTLSVNEAHKAQQDRDLHEKSHYAPGNWTRGPETLLDLDTCAAAYPAFISYLERRFGKRMLKAPPEPVAGDMRHKVQTSRDSFEYMDVSNKKVGRVVHLTIAWDALKEALVLNSSQKWGNSPHTFYNLERTLGRHGELIFDEMSRLGGTFSMAWRGDLIDPPCARDGHLPLHGTSSEDTKGDIAMPDWTFFKYASIHSDYVNSAWRSNDWADVSSRLADIQPHQKGIFYSGSWRGGPRKTLRDVAQERPPEDLVVPLRELMPEGFNVTLLKKATKGSEELGRRGWVSLYEQCSWLHTFHTIGNHYSAMLKYKMACGQTVFFLTQLSKDGHPLQEEFWYDALQHGKNIFFFRGEKNFWDVLREILGGHPDQPLGPHPDVAGAKRKLERVAQAGKRVVETYLSQHGLDCYIMLYLKRYYLPLLLQNSGKP